MIEIEILQDTVADGKPVYAGQVIKVKESDARLLVALGKARPAGKHPKKDVRGGGRRKAVED